MLALLTGALVVDLSAYPEGILCKSYIPFTGSQQDVEEICTPYRYRSRPDHYPQCLARQPLTGHGFYRTLESVDVGFQEFWLPAASKRDFTS
jgi:hypothetical protein